MEKKNKTIESAGGILLNNGRIALVKNIRANFWGFPKGKIEKNESALEAAKREIFEETGVKEVSLVKKLGTYKRKAADGKPVILNNHIFLFKTNKTKLDPFKNEALDAKWVVLDEVVNILALEDDKTFFQSIKNIILL